MNKIKKYIRHHLVGLTIILACGIVASLPFFSDRLIVGNDYYFNQARMQSTVNSIKDGQLLPQVDPSAFGGWGHSWNIFYGPLVTYLVIPIKIFTSWPIAINILSIILLVSSGITMYIFAFTVSKKRKLALIAAILFMLSSPLILTAFRSNNQGRMLVVTLMPLVFDGLYRIIYKQKYGVILLSFSAAGVILSHMLSAAILALATIVFIIANIKRIDKSMAVNIIKATAITIGLSAFFILPFLEAQKLGIYNISNKEFQQTAMSMTASTAFESSISPGALLFKNQEFPVSGIFIQLWVVIGAASTIFLSKSTMPKKIFRNCCYLWISLALLLLVCTPYIPWDKMPSSFYTLQFPSRRLLPLITFIASVIGAAGIYYALPKFKSEKNNTKIFYLAISSLIIICFSVISPAIGFYSQSYYSTLQPSKILSHVDDSSTVPEDIWKNIVEPFAISSGEYLPTSLSVAGHRNPDSTRHYSYTIASANFLLTRGDQPKSSDKSLLLSDYKKIGSHMSVNFVSKNSSLPSTIEMPAIYYPGYKAVVEINKQQSYTLSTTASENGLVNVSLPTNYKGGTVHIWYGLSTWTTIGLLATLTTIITLSVFWVVYRIKNKRRRNR
mgnify:FL=1|jgi:uncharacterized protein llmg_1573